MADGQVDTSITAGIGQNMMGNIAQIANTINAVNQNRLFTAKVAAGQLLQESIDPNTGQPDLQKFNRLLANDRRTAPFAQDALTTSLDQSGKVIANTTASRALQQAKGDYVRTAIGALGANASQEAVLTALRIGAATGQIDPQFASTIAGSMPSDPTQIAAWAQNNFQLPALGAQGAMDATVGPVTQIDTGPAINLVRTPQLGEPKAIGSINKSLSPAESVAPAYEEYNPTTQRKEIVTKGAALSAQQGGQGGPIISSPALGEESAATGSADLLTAARSDVSSSATRIFQLQKAGEALDQAQTGHGAQTLQNWRSMLVTLGIAPQSEIDKVANFDEARKYLNGYALSAATRFGAGTDNQLATTLSSNASTSISNLAAKDVVKATVGLERMKQAQLAAFDASGLSPAKFGEFTSRWNQDTDPRAFIVDQIPVAKRQAMIKAMKPTEQKRFLNSVRAAVASGALSLSDIK